MNTKRNKTGGRKAGTPNKITTSSRELLHQLLIANIERIQSDLDDMTPADRVKALLAIAKLVIPAQTEDVTPQYNELPQPIFKLMTEKDQPDII